MLSYKPIKSGGEAKHYFIEQDNYYLKDSPEALEASRWLGKGAETLGLEGAVNPEMFEQLLHGKLPDGKQLGKLEDGEVKHRPGWDLTLSAPKSVSILAEVGGDKRIYVAHDKAVKETLAYIERSCAQARKFVGGVTVYENTQNVVAAVFRHDTSREMDPQLHSHMVVMNMTLRPDRKWLSLASDINGYNSGGNGFIERVSEHKIFFGTIYRSMLAYELKNLGYEVVLTHQDGRFEIAGVPKNVMEHFSQRRKEIEAFMKLNQWEGAKAAAFATLETRNKKQGIDREILHQEWSARAQALNFDVKAFVQNSEKSLNNSTLENAQNNSNQGYIKEAVQFAIQHLSESDVKLSHHRIINTALTQIFSKEVKVNEIITEIDLAIQAKQLLPVHTKNSETFYTTQTLLDQEQKLLALVGDGQYKTLPLSSEGRATKFAEQQGNLSFEQKEAIKTLSASLDRFTILTGVSGSGKTTVLARLSELARQEGSSVIYLTSRQNDVLSWTKTYRNAAHTAKTVSGFIHFTQNALDEKRVFQKHHLILVDKAEQLSPKQLIQLAGIAEKTQSKIVFSGDDKGFLSREAGSPFSQLIEHGAKTMRLSQNQRDMDISRKEAIKETLVGNIESAFQKIQHRMIEENDLSRRYQKMAAHYMGLSKEERATAYVLMQNQLETKETNLLVRKTLKQVGLISEADKAYQVYLPKSLSIVEKTSAINYEEGWYLRFNEAMSKSKIRKHDYWQVTQVDASKNVLTLRNAKGKETTWSPKTLNQEKGAAIVEAFVKEKRNLSIGEALLVQRANLNKGLHSGDRLEIVQLHDKWVKVQNRDGKQFKLDVTEPRNFHLDYGYATTPQRAQHLDANILIAHQDSQKYSTHQKQFYKILSQAKDNVWLYTDDKQAYLTRLMTTKGGKSTAIETLLEGKVQQGHEVTYIVDPQKPLTSQLNELEKNIRYVVEQIYQNLPEKTRNTSAIDGIAKEATRYAMAQLAEREAAFTHKELLETSLKHAMGKITPQHAEEIIRTFSGDKEIIRGVEEFSGTKWTTQAAIERERDILNILKQGINQVTPLLSPEQVKEALKDSLLSQDKQQAVTDVLTSQDQFILLQASAGTGKTTLVNRINLDFIKNLSESTEVVGYHMKGVAPTHTAVDELNKRGIPSQTLQSFLMEAQRLRESNKVPDLSKTIFVLDEASMVSNRDFHDFVKFIAETKSRAIPTGDIAQHSSPEAGKPFEIAQKAGIKTTYLTEIFRQHEQSMALKEAIRHVLNKDYVDAMSSLNRQQTGLDGEFSLNAQTKSGNSLKTVPPQVIEIKSRDSRLANMADDYLSRSIERRKETRLIVPLNNDRVYVNALVRDGLKSEGGISRQGYQFDILVPRHFSHVDASRAINYQEGDILRFNRSLYELDIRRDAYFVVKNVDALANALVLTKSDSKNLVMWELPAHENMPRGLVEVYKREERELSVGDQIYWTRSDKRQGFKSGVIGTVEKISDTSVGIVLADGSAKQLDRNNATHRHWDYNYAITSYGSQGGGFKEVIAHQDSHDRTTSQRDFYVITTRAMQQVTLYTDNQERLIEKIQATTGDKYSALEVIGALKDSRVKKSQILNLKDKQPDGIHDKKTLKDVVRSWDSKDINAKLTDQTEYIVQRLLGDPKHKNAREWRYGSHKGSFVVSMQGKSRGLWNDFQTGEGGNLIKLIAREYQHANKDFGETLEVAAKLLGLSESQKMDVPKGEFNKKEDYLKDNRQASFSDDEKKRIAFAQKIAGETLPITGTIAERYLKEHRAIQKDLPGTLRFHPALYSSLNKTTSPALIAIAKNKDGEVQAIQATYLDTDTANKANLSVVKQTFGVLKGAVVSLQEGSSRQHPVMYAEGIETALSLREAEPDKAIHAVLGSSNFKNISTGSDKVILALDNDGNNKATQKMIEHACENLQQDGKTIFVNQPDEVKKDYNDVLKEKGVEAIKQFIDASKQVMPVHEEKKTDIEERSRFTEKEINRLITENPLEPLKDKQLELSREPVQIEKTKVPDIEREI